MEEVVQYCYICKNRCPLSSPKCAAAKSPEMVTQREKIAKTASETCRICDKHCPLDDLGCSLGQTIHSIKTAKN